MKKRISILLMLLLIMAAALSGCGKEEKVVIKEPVLAKTLKGMFDRRTATFTKEELGSIHELTLEYREAADLQELGYLTNLQLLDISCEYDLDFSVLKNMTSLEYLYIDSVPVISVEELAALGTVKVLSLSNTKTVSLAGLENFPELTELYITGSVITDASTGMEALDKLKVCEVEIQEENLVNTKDISFVDSGVEEAVRMTVNNMTQTVTQEQMNQIEALVLMDETIASLEDLTACKYLKSIMLWNTQVKDLSPLLEISSLTEVIIYSEQELDYSALYEKEQIKSICINGNWVKNVK